MLCKEVEAEKKEPLKERENATFLCLCHGNVLRSQWAEYYLKMLGFNAISAALGDVSLQKYQREVPLIVLGLMRAMGFEGALQGNLIKEVTKEMVDSATYILIFCDPKFAEDYPFIDLNDDRVHIIMVPDPFGDCGAYRQTIVEITNKIDMFLNDLFETEDKPKNMERNPPAYGGRFSEDNRSTAFGWSDPWS